MVSAIENSGAAAALYSYTAQTNAPRVQSANSAASGGSPADSIVLSDRAKLLAAVPLPSFDNIAAQAAQLSASLNGLFAKAGIPTSPPIGFSVDPNNAHVKVTGNRADAKEIEDLINGDPALQLQIHNLDAAGSQYSALAGPAKFSRAYEAATNQAQVNAALDKYAYLLGGAARKTAAISLSFDGTVSVDANGKPLPRNLVDLPG